MDGPPSEESDLKSEKTEVVALGTVLKIDSLELQLRDDVKELYTAAKQVANEKLKQSSEIDDK